MKARRNQKCITRNGTPWIERVVIKRKGRGAGFVKGVGIGIKGLCNWRWEWRDCWGGLRFRGKRHTKRKAQDGLAVLHWPPLERVIELRPLMWKRVKCVEKENEGGSENGC